MKENRNIIIEKKSDYETQGEWIERIGGNIARVVSLLFIILMVAGAVVHIATGMWTNLILDFAAIVALSFGIVYRDKE